MKTFEFIKLLKSRTERGQNDKVTFRAIQALEWYLYKPGYAKENIEDIGYKDLEPYNNFGKRTWEHIVRVREENVLSIEDKLIALQATDEIKKAVLLLKAAMDDMGARSYLRFGYNIEGVSYELTFMKIQNVVNYPSTQPTKS
jgi:hypothetical protein